MTKLSELASLVRSKNAGPFTLTFDILFDNKEKYDRVKNSGVLTVELFSSLYKCAAESVRFFECDNALGFKYSMPRPRFQADLGDADLHGGQQNVLLMDVEIP
ncbi:protein of unknown function [Xaviernesmea oryzae]|uniref:DUF4387 domain-containing protein n=1 Tax=Xaviernesmea oryzae TaxID=464029 RepID=A0A1X7FQE2_9HYPH|nr:DUF4387 domain-containing protein [Xaviernesmea oryzae]SMF56044.1 protein of unknown function [Xaviernesmea oryzae]